MRKTGRPRNPEREIILTLSSVGIYGLFWFAIALEELREYRGKGIPGGIAYLIVIINLPLIFVPWDISVVLYFIPILSLLFFIFHIFSIPYHIEKERNKAGEEKNRWFLVAILPLIGFFCLYAGYYIEVNMVYEIIGIVLILFSPVFVFSWMYFAQKGLNSLWRLEIVTSAFAIPEMKQNSKSENSGITKENINE